jgi:iron complex outermembrane receptor protein/vitamin B12 transporter
MYTARRCWTLALWLMVIVPAGAQDTAIVRGTIVDPLGAEVSGAAVKLLDRNRIVKETTSDAQGAFSFESLAEGRYRLEASFAGFQTRVTDPMFVSGGARLSVEVALPIGPLEQSVSVTAAATDVLPSQIGAPVTVIDSRTLDLLGKPDVSEALRLMPGVSLVQAGARGGVTSIFVRGGNSNFNKVLIDGIPVNDIGGSIDLSQYSIAGVERIEALRDPNSVVFGSDALSGVVSITSRRGRTPVPAGILSVDGGSLGTDHESAAIGGTIQRVDYFSEIAHLGTDNDLPNNKARNTTYAGRFGVALGHSTDLSGTVRVIDRRYESPGSISLYGTPDDAFQTFDTRLFGLVAQTQLTDRWQTAVRFGSLDQRSHYDNPTLSGEDIGGLGFGDVVTITGANGYSVTGRGILDYGPSQSDSRSTRRGVYGQTTYQVMPDVSVSGGANFEREEGFPGADIHGDPTTTRNNSVAWAEGRGTVLHRVSVTAGIGYAHNQVFKSAWSPRLSVAAYLRPPTAAGFWGDTRLTVNAGKGIKAPTVFQSDNSLYALLTRTPAGTALAEGAGIGPIGPERGRNVDLGIEQGMWDGRARVRVAYFDNAFYDLVESVSRNLLPQLGIPVAVAATVTSANVNSQSFTARGVETSADAQVGRVSVAASYTHASTEVTRSLSSGALSPSFNPAFPGIAIGNFSPLLGQRPFRRPPNTGSLLVSYTQGPAAIGLSGYFAGKSNDTTFLGGSDLNFGNSLLLPNDDLNPGYAKIDVSGSYAFHRNLKWYATIENLLDRHYEPAFGFPALPVNIRTGVTVTLGGR